MGTFIEAIKEIADLDMLFYVPAEVATSAAAVSGYERSLSLHWNANLRLFLCPRTNQEASQSKWAMYGREAVSFFKQPVYADTSGARQLEAFEDRLQDKPDVIFAHRLASMCPPLRTRRPLPPIVFDLDDIEHVAFLRSIDKKWRWRSQLLYSTRLPALWLGERRAIQLAYRTFVCSESDRNYLEDRWRLARILTVPNAVATAPQLPVVADPTLLFLGSYSYSPNVQAAEYLIQRIWPHIYRKMPSARLFIAGPHMEMIRGRAAGIQGVELMGFVDDLDVLYQRSRVVCCPVLAGSGTRIKIAEAAAFGKPIVATRLGAEGLDLQDGAELLLRDDPRKFADACLELLENSALCERLGSAARNKALQLYDRGSVVRLIQECLQTIEPPVCRELQPSGCRSNE